MQSQPASIWWTVNLQQYFIIVAVTQIILIYELDVLNIFDITIVCPY